MSLKEQKYTKKAKMTCPNREGSGSGSRGK
jgi:hypothetical protein